MVDRKGLIRLQMITIENQQVERMTQLNLKFKNMEEVNAYAEAHEKILLIHGDYVLDVTTFHSHHPGGGVLLRNKNLKNIDEDMKFHHPLTLTMADSMVIGSFKKQISRMIDPEKVLLPQIWNLTEEQYNSIINSPHWLFVPSPRMFEWDFFEAFSHIKWYHILLYPVILFSYLLYRVDSWSSFNPLLTLSYFLGGVLAFSLLEYLMHKYLFHSQKWLPDSKLIRYLHFILHGIHHMLPNDPDRLVHPPVLAIIETFFLFPFFNKFLCKVLNFEDPILFAFFYIGVGIGYITYDLMHWSLHHIDTSKNKGTLFHRLQKYHNKHHFGGENAGFGVSSPLWDYIFFTTFKREDKKQ